MQEEKVVENLNIEENDAQGAEGVSAQSAIDEKCAKKAKKEKKNEELERVKAELLKTQAEVEEVTRKWYAVTAEYENYRRRTQNQSAQRYQEGRNDVIGALFPVGDNIERAILSCHDENVKQGLDMVLKAFKKVLEGEGVEEINPLGQPFNADFAEAIMAAPAENSEESGTVKQVYLKGYKKGDKVLRYAQVIVVE